MSEWMKGWRQYIILLALIGIVGCGHTGVIREALDAMGEIIELIEEFEGEGCK